MRWSNSGGTQTLGLQAIDFPKHLNRRDLLDAAEEMMSLPTDQEDAPQLRDLLKRWKSDLTISPATMLHQFRSVAQGGTMERNGSSEGKNSKYLLDFVCPDY
ncbi:hypothetical protein I302_104098 [Kwoniella bestiolae CBS 10118]|uniref:Uncharacterized protein n=1 Tax=Kwoniella bestiolae CBS 10118 TaxID=1296100 RepID=A0A1B9GAA9_9TREE|nr:hypothetical protein I302_02806 [Kwoniella bestiolae CBS 10118]OCF27956.1 hypothetical protein I302_02806 [Kwoniella bestiolae CBS 10118]